MSGPTWSPVDEQTGSLLDLIADDEHPSVDYEWDIFRQAILQAADPIGVVRQNSVRPLIAGKIAPRRVGPMYRRACREGLIYATDQWEQSDDKSGKNAGRPVRIYRRKPAPIGGAA